MADCKANRCVKHRETETGGFRKNWKDKIRIALVYPNRYAVGLSNLGFQTVYRLLNSFESVVCERVFLPEPGDIIHSVESNRKLGDFHVVAFSISFENDYLHLITLLRDSGIPFQSSQRNDAHPIVIAGGVACFVNPEPIACFIDCFLIGEAECMLPQFISCLESRPADRRSLLSDIVHMTPGAYVPAFYEDRYTPDGHFESLTPIEGVPSKILRCYCENISETPSQSSIVTPHSSFGNIYLIEVGRGCPHGCRFCSAGYIYRPPRFTSLPVLESCIRNGILISSRIGLVGAAVSDLPDIDKLCIQAQEAGVRLSFSSLRADALTPELVASLAVSHVKTATLAPDAGSERMRQVINKNITEFQILESTASLVSAGIPNLKLYFMIGLPTETLEDIESIICLCQKIKHVFLESSRVQKHIGEITISINAFIPKPFTPFQWSAMEKMPLLKKKLKLIICGLKKIPNVRIDANNFKEAVVSALLSRGDRRVSRILIEAARYSGNWRKVFKEMSDFPLSFHVHRERPLVEPFPWDHIDNRIHKNFLKQEYLRAQDGKISPACPIKGCQLCGACD